MAEETWRIIYSEESSSGTAGGGSAAESQAVKARSEASSKSQEQAAEETKKAAPTWSLMGRFLAPLVGVAGVLAFVVQMIRRSKVFSTFMDNFLTVLSAVVDILMLPLIPLLAPVLKWFLKLIPIAMKVSEAISNFLKDPWSGIKNIFASLVNLPEKIGEFFKKIFRGTGLEGFGETLANIGKIFTDAGKKIAPMFNAAVNEIQRIWADKGTSFWEKIGATAVAVWDFVKAAAPIMWDAIKTTWTTIVVPAVVGWATKFFGTDAGAMLNALLTGQWSNAWNTFCNWIGPRIENIWNNFYLNTLVPTWTKFYEGTLKPNWITFTTTVGVLWNALLTDLKRNWGVILGTIKILWTALTSNIHAWFSWLIKDVLPVYWKYVTDFVAVLWDNFMVMLGPKLLEGFLMTLAMIGKYAIIGVAAVLESIGRLIYQGIIDIFVVAAYGIVQAFVIPINSIIKLLNTVKIFGKIKEIDTGTAGEWVDKANVATIPESWGEMFKNLLNSMETVLGTNDRWEKTISDLVGANKQNPNLKPFPPAPLVLKPGQNDITLKQGQSIVPAPPDLVWKDALALAGKEIGKIDFDTFNTALGNISDAFGDANKIIKDNSKAVDDAVDAQKAARIAFTKVEADFKSGKATIEEYVAAQELLSNASENYKTTIATLDAAIKVSTTLTMQSGTELSTSVKDISNIIQGYVKQQGLANTSMSDFIICLSNLNIDVLATSVAFKTAIDKINVQQTGSLPKLLPAGPTAKPPLVQANTSNQATYNPLGSVSPDTTGGVGFDIGSRFVPKDMMAMVHRGEQIIPAGQNKTTNTYSKPININNVYNIQAGSEDLLAEIKAAADQSLKYNQMRGYI